MQYIKITDDKWIEFDSVTNTSKVLSKSELQGQIDKWVIESDALPEATDEFLLQWAKDNYPIGRQKDLLKNLIDTAQLKIDSMV